MASAAVDTGVGATVALATSTFTASITNVGEVREIVEALDTTHLGVASTSNATFMAGDNPELQDVPITFLFDSQEAVPRARAVASENLTITLPAADTNNTTVFSLVISGFVRESVIVPTLARNQVNTGTLVFRPDGSTVTVTVET